MTKRKNLYLKIETKLIKPDDKEIDKLLNIYLKRKVIENNNQPLNHSPEDLEQIRLEIQQSRTVHNHQLRKISKIPALANFIANNINGIKEAGQPILLKKEHYDDLLKKSNIGNIPYLHIWASSDVVLCTIHPISKELLQNALKNEQISADRYEELLNLLENNESKEGIMEENMAQ